MDNETSSSGDSGVELLRDWLAGAPQDSGATAFRARYLGSVSAACNVYRRYYSKGGNVLRIDISN